MKLVRDEADAPYDGQAKAERNAGVHVTILEDATFDDALALGPIPFTVYCYLDRHANRDGQHAVSYNRIAEDCHISRRTAARTLKLLCDKKFIVAKTPPDTRQSHKPNLYTLPRHYRGASASVALAPSELVSELVPQMHQASAKASATDALKVDTSRYREDDPFPSDEPPLLNAMRVALCEARGVTTLSGKFKADMDAVCRDLLSMGATPVDVPNLTAWAQTHDFWGNAGGTKTGKGYSLKQLPTIYEQWTSAGRPKRRRSVFSNVAPEAR